MYYLLQMQAAKAEAQLLENIDNINTSVDDLERQVSSMDSCASQAL